MQPCSTARPNANNQIGLRATAACVQTTRWPPIANTFQNLSKTVMLVLKSEPFCRPQNLSSQPILACGPWVTHLCLSILNLNPVENISCCSGNVKELALFNFESFKYGICNACSHFEDRHNQNICITKLNLSAECQICNKY